MKTTLGVIFGNRDFFPDHLVSEARKDILALFQEMNIEGVMLGENETKLGSVETYAHSRACADLFKANRDRIAGGCSPCAASPEHDWRSPWLLPD